MRQTRPTPIDRRACTPDRRGPVSLFHVTLDRRARTPDRQTRLTREAAPRTTRSSDRRWNNVPGHVYRSRDTASDDSPTPGPKPRARVWRQTLHSIV
jgi:hypothetical protein